MNINSFSGFVLNNAHITWFKMKYFLVALVVTIFCATVNKQIFCTFWQKKLVISNVSILKFKRDHRNESFWYNVKYALWNSMLISEIFIFDILSSDSRRAYIHFSDLFFALWWSRLNAHDNDTKLTVIYDYRMCWLHHHHHPQLMSWHYSKMNLSILSIS